MGGKAGPGDKECGAGLGEECEARPGEKDGKPGLGEKDGKAGLGEETLLWLGLSLRRVGKGTPDNKVSSAFERSDLLGLCSSFTSARTLLVNALHPRPLAVHHLAGRQGREPSSRVAEPSRKTRLSFISINVSSLPSSTYSMSEASFKAMPRDSPTRHPGFAGSAVKDCLFQSSS